MNDGPVQVRELPQESFPHLVEIWARGADRRGRASWSAVVEGPGALRIPAMGPGAWVRITFPQEQVQIVAPPGYDEGDF